MNQQACDGTLREIRLPQVAGRNVDGEDEGKLRATLCSKLLQGCFEHPDRHRLGQSRPLDQRNELAWRDIAERRVMPTQEGFCTHTHAEGSATRG